MTAAGGGQDHDAERVAELQQINMTATWAPSYVFVKEQQTLTLSVSLCRPRSVRPS